MHPLTDVRAAASLVAAILAAFAASLLLAGPAQAKPAASPVISQVSGGGGNAGAQFRSDFIELFNRKGSPQDLTGWSVQYSAAASSSWTVTPLSGTLGIGNYFLVAEGDGGGGAGAALPAADATGTIDMSNTSGKVALVSSFTPLVGNCPTGAPVIDMVGYGVAANCSKGSPTPNLSNTTAAMRKAAGCTDTASNLNDFSVLAPTPRNSATARNLCSAIPAAPAPNGTVPTSPSNDLAPEVRGTAPAGTSVELYTNSLCSGSPTATGTAALFTGAGITATVAPNSTTTFYALAFDANNSSACSTASVTYANDNVAPSAPTVISTSPPSPANDLNPEVRGSAADGTTVKLFTNAACTVQVASATANAFASPGITATVGPNSTTTFFATATDAAGNASACSSSSITYVQDSDLPVAPTFNGSVPTSPASDASPNIKGNAEAGSTVRLYTNALCTVLAGTGSAAQFASSGISAPVAPNSSTTFRATATDAVGNTSACSPSTFTYTEDSAAPAEPTFSSSTPISPAANNTPRLNGNSDAGSIVRIYRDAACTIVSASGTAAQFTGAGIDVSVPSNSSTTFHATATDAVGNTSPCSSSSLTYIEDSAPPAQPVLTASDAPSPSTDTNPRIIGSADPGTTVRLYSDAGCTVLAGTGSAAQFGSTGIPVTVAPNSTTTFNGIATDAVGNDSACSASSLTYVSDTTPPGPPTLISTSPRSPANDLSPEVRGSAAHGTTVKLYTDAACATQTASGDPDEFASPGITATVAADSTTTFYATATDTLGNESVCSSSSITYVEDSSLPVAPTFTGSLPASPANDTVPNIKGDAEAGSTVNIYTDGLCTALAGTGTAAQFSSSGISVTVAPNSSTTFRATATDGVGNTSACSPTTFTYTEDSAAPAMPTFASSTPASPAADNSPRLIGTADAGSTVEIFRDADCTTLSATGTGVQFSGTGIQVTVPSNTSTTFHAIATDALGNTSPCSTSSLTYVEDSTPPAQPVLTSNNPPSPSAETNPLVIGNSDAGSTVRLYSDVACTVLVGNGTAAQFAAPGIGVTVAPNSTTTFHAIATDAVGNDSACSSSSLTYVSDTAPPPAPTTIVTSPPSPANDLNPEVRGSAADGTTVKLFTDAACTVQVASGTANAFASPGITATVGPNSTTTFYASATDPAGNASACSSSSITYVQDSDLPVTPTFTGSVPGSPANDTSPNIKGNAESGSTVHLYTDGSCTALAGTGSAAQFSSSGISVTVAPNSSTTFRATATDGVGNTSPCSTGSLTYVEDSDPPAQPLLTSSDPASPSTDTNPLIIGNAEPGSTVRLFSDDACTIGAGNGPAAQFASPGIGVTVATDSTTTFHAIATDAVGNASACSSSSLTYANDSGAPEAPMLTVTNPASPSTSTSPRILGSAEPGTTVRLYTDAACTQLAAVGSAAELSAPGIQVSVAAGSTTVFHATATDALDTASACSPDSVIYTQATPSAPTTTDVEAVPHLSGLFLAPPRFGIEKRQTSVGAASANARGTTIHFNLSAKARVSFTVLRRPQVNQAPGPTAGLVKTFGRVLEAGPHAVPFSGRLGQRVFRPGKYRLIVSAQAPSGGATTSASAPFKILKP